MDEQSQLEMIRRSACSSHKNDIVSIRLPPNDDLSTIKFGDESTEEASRLTSTPSVLNASVAEVDHFQATAAAVESVLMTRLVPALCAAGLIGNIATLILLAIHGLRRHLGRMEKFATSGLAVLAVTDALFCLSVQPLAFFSSKPKMFHSEQVSFNLLYSVYHNAVINTFIATSSWITATSSWITVTLALVRHIAVCHPLWARYFIGPTAAMRFFVAIIISSIFLNIPRFFIYRVELISCPDSTVLRYFRFYGWLRYNPSVELAYWWVYAIFGALLPFCLLAFANVNLIRSLRQASIARAAATASRVRSSLSGTSPVYRKSGGGELGCHVTLTLVIVVALYLVLVTPAEVLNVLRELFPVVTTGRRRKSAYNLCVAIVNTLQVRVMQ